MGVGLGAERMDRDMKLITKEHADLMAQFEKAFNLKGRQVEKESKKLWAKSNIYQHGETNLLFLAYRAGYASGKCAERLGIYDGQSG